MSSVDLSYSAKNKFKYTLYIFINTVSMTKLENVLEMGNVL